MSAAAKAIGAILTVFGVLALVGGLAAAAYALIDIDAHRDDLVRDRERDRMDEALLVGGAVAAAIGLVAFLAGLITLVASRPRPAAPAAPATAPAASAKEAQRPAPRPGIAAPTPRNAALAGAVAVVLVGVLLVAVWLASTGRGGEFFGGPGPPTALAVLDRAFNGTVERGSVGVPGLPGLPAVDNSKNTGEFTPPEDADACTATLDWDPNVPAGAQDLTLNVTRGSSGVVDQTGGPGFSTSIDPHGMAGAPHRFKVTAPAGAFVSQPFRLRVVCVAS